MSSPLEWKQISVFIGVRLREYRHRLGLTQEQVADLTEVHRNYYGRLERGEENPTLEIIVRLARAYSIPLSDLFDSCDALKSQGPEG